MDLGFEGGFSVHSNSVNASLRPDFIEKHLKENLIQLKKTKFKTVFANDILIEARNAWVHHFSKRQHSENFYHTESVVDIVRTHQSHEGILPKEVDIVTGGFPCQDFSIAGKRKGFDSSKNHLGEHFDSGIATADELSHFWKRSVSNVNRLEQWLELVSGYACQLQGTSSVHFPNIIRKMSVLVYKNTYPYIQNKLKLYFHFPHQNPEKFRFGYYYNSPKPASHISPTPSLPQNPKTEVRSSLFFGSDN